MFPAYKDHIALWTNELKAWVPERIFDAHVHLGPPGIVSPVTDERCKLALSTFTHFDWEELNDCYQHVFAGKHIGGLIAFPFPQREVDLDLSNDYLIELMKANSRITGFLASHPTDVNQSIATYRKAVKNGVCFRGVKPYADRLGKSNFDARMEEFIPDKLLQFMNSEGLAMMLHTSGIGVGAPETRHFLRTTTERYPRIPILLAHMGRYIEPGHFFQFLNEGVLEACPSLYLEMSSTSSKEVYERVLARRSLWKRLIFGSDMPFGLITGVERWSRDQGAIFLSRDDYPWSDASMHAQYAAERKQLTYNTYHCIKALKDAVAGLGLSVGDANELKQAIFYTNANNLFGHRCRLTQAVVKSVR
ncbi:MAG: amidohydrolase family protein [Kiritimatiellaeota bacterium]|nr:amidohydrolase family protein [Kiritimatiellota bacterium]